MPRGCWWAVVLFLAIVFVLSALGTGLIALTMVGLLALFDVNEEQGFWPLLLGTAPLAALLGASLASGGLFVWSVVRLRSTYEARQDCRE